MKELLKLPDCVPVRIWRCFIKPLHNFSTKTKSHTNVVFLEVLFTFPVPGNDFFHEADSQR